MLVIDPSEHYLICRNAVMTGLAELSCWRITTLSRRDEEAAVLCQGYDMINLSSRVKVKHESKQFPSSDDCCSV